MESHLFSMFKSFAQGIGGSPKKILLGICAMDKKAKSKPMQEILGRLPDDIFEVVIFGDDCILNQPIETWPEVECLIAFSSSKYPTEKALEYIELRKPFLVNDLGMDNVLRDRRKVYKTLLEHGIEVPKHVVLDREDPNVNNTVEEYDEYVIINGVQINKPLVEKPVDAEDHNVYIYYPMSAGGGSKRLFRKVNDRSSEFYPRENELRTSGSYIYEEFIITQGTDVKVYTVGPDYGHAEARKSPVVDGKVARDSSGMEVRYPVILTHEEKDLIRKITTAFRQTVCGFDILRVRDKSLVCDVNGWSFVKNSRKYYDDASKVLADYMISALRPKLKQRRPRSIKLMGNKNRSRSRSPFSDPEKLFMTNNPNSFASMNESIDSSEELRCVVAVIRHGDRTPKQKMKLNVQEPKYLAYFHQFAKSPRKDLKVKSKSALVRFLEVTREVLAEGRKSNPVEVFQKFKQIKDVLERWEISGINRL